MLVCDAEMCLVSVVRFCVGVGSKARTSAMRLAGLFTNQEGDKGSR